MILYVIVTQGNTMQSFAQLSPEFEAVLRKRANWHELQGFCTAVGKQQIQIQQGTVEFQMAMGCPVQ